MSKRAVILLLSLAVWVLGAFTLWSLLGTLEAGCKLQERNSGLWAECFAPAAQIYTGLFVLLLLLDMVRVAIAWRALRTSNAAPKGQND